MITCPMHPNDPPHPQCDESCQYHCAHAAKEKADDRLAGTPCSPSYFTFRNKDGQTIQLRGDLTMEDLIRMRYTDIRLTKPEKPLAPHEWRADPISSENTNSATTSQHITQNLTSESK